MSKKIAVIDGNSLMHRAYHAVQTPMTAKDGTPTNAVFGFLTMLCKFIEMASPDAVVCAFDAGKPVHRIEAMVQYKAQRPPMDEELHVQFPVIQELLESMAIPRGEGARLGGRRHFGHHRRPRRGARFRDPARHR